MSEGHAMNVHARKRTVFSSKFTEENVVFQRGDSSTRASSLENLLFFFFVLIIDGVLWRKFHFIDRCPCKMAILFGRILSQKINTHTHTSISFFVPLHFHAVRGACLAEATVTAYHFLTIDSAQCVFTVTSSVTLIK